MKFLHKKTKQYINFNPEDLEMIEDAKKLWVEHKKNSVVNINNISMSSSDIGDIIYEQEKKELTTSEILEFEKMIESLKSNKLEKPLSYYGQEVCYGGLKGKGYVISGILFGATHWSLIDYLEKIGAIVKVDDKYGWAVAGEKDLNDKEGGMITPVYSEFMTKWRLYQRLLNERERAKNFNLKGILSEMKKSLGYEIDDRREYEISPDDQELKDLLNSF